MEMFLAYVYPVINFCVIIICIGSFVSAGVFIYLVCEMMDGVSNFLTYRHLLFQKPSLNNAIAYWQNLDRDLAISGIRSAFSNFAALFSIVALFSIDIAYNDDYKEFTTPHVEGTCAKVVDVDKIIDSRQLNTYIVKIDLGFGNIRPAIIKEFRVKIGDIVTVVMENDYYSNVAEGYIIKPVSMGWI